MAKVLLAVAATAAVGVAALVLTQRSSENHSEEKGTDTTKKIQSEGATSAKGIALKNATASAESGKEKHNVGSPVPKAFETRSDKEEPNGVSDFLTESAKSKDRLRIDNGLAPVAKPSELVSDGGHTGELRAGNGSEAEGERSQKAAMPKAVENDHTSGSAAQTGGDLAGSPIKARTTVDAHPEKAAGSDGNVEDQHNASRLQAYEDFALTPPDSPPAKVTTPVKAAETRAARSSSGMAELVLKKVPSRGSSMDKEKASTPKAESPTVAQSTSEADDTAEEKSTPVARSTPVAETNPSVVAKQALVTPPNVKVLEAESRGQSGKGPAVTAEKSGGKSEAKREDTGRSASSAVVDKDASTPVKSTALKSTKKPGSPAKSQPSEAPKAQSAVTPKDAPAMKQPSASSSVKSEATPAKKAVANGPPEKKADNPAASNPPATAGKAPEAPKGPVAGDAPKGGQATVPKETPVSTKPSFAALTKSPPKHPQSQTKSSIPAPPTNSERRPSGSYADMTKPTSGKSPSTSFSSPPPDGARFGFVAKLPKLATSPSSSRSNSVAGSPTPVSTQVGFDVANPKPEAADTKPSKPLSPSAAAFVPATKSEAGPKGSGASNGKAEEGNGKRSEGVKGKMDGNVGSGDKVESVAENGKVDKSKGGDALSGTSKDQAATKPPTENDPAVKSVAASRADAAGLSLPISIPGSVTGGEKEELLSEAETETETESAATTPATTPAVSPNQKGGYIEGVVWNADKTAKNKAKRDKKKAKKSKTATTSGAS